MSPQRRSTPAELLSAIQPGHRIFLHGAGATPISLTAALAADHARLRDVEIMHLHTHGPAPYADHPEFRVTNLFVGENLRARLDYDRIDYLPCFLSEIPRLFRDRIRAPDVAVVQVSPPDASGYCSLGTSVDVARAAVDAAAIVLAQVNPRLPRTHGDGCIPFSRVTAYWEHAEELTGPAPRPAGAVERAIAREVAALVDDGATIQVGIGAVPDAVLECLRGHRHLGVHTETFSDGMIPLLESGAVDNSRKGCHRHRTVTSFVTGSPRVYRFVHDNPSVLFLESDYVNRDSVIARNPKVVAINSAVEVDLTGQVVADSVGSRILSGVGGQMDFVRGATLSEGGKAVIALPSRTRAGAARIVPTLQRGAGVVTTRAHVHYVVTEFGAADLRGKTLHERARALVSLAHPDDREALDRAWADQIRSIQKKGDPHGT